MILVTGGTGLVGSHLLYFLLKNNQTVRAIHRKKSDLEGVKKVFTQYTTAAEALFSQIEWVEANITDVPALTKAFQGVSYVYHAAAFISFNPKHYYTLKKINIEGTANVVNLCLSQGVKKLCYVSSIATLGSSVNKTLITEETAWNSEADNNVYAITKYGAEMEVWRGTQEGLTAVIVNPGLIFGAGPSGYRGWNSGSESIVKQVSKGMPYYTSGGVGIVDVKDVVSAMIAVLNDPIKNEQYILVGENMLHKDLLQQLANQLQVKPANKEISKWKLQMVSKLDWFSNKVFGTKRRLLKAMIDSLYNVSFYDASKIKKELNFSFTPAEKTLKNVAEQYLKK